MIGQYLLYITGGFMILASLMPYVRSDYWVFRIFEYPRLQKWGITALVILAYILYMDLETPFQWGFLIALLVNLAHLSYQIYPFLPIAKVQMARAVASQPEQEISLLISNVLQDNKVKDRLISLIQARQPHIIVLSETDAQWAKAMEAIHADYPYRVAEPLDNTYGIMLFSKYELTDTEINYIVEEDVPSIFAKIRLPSGKLVQLYCLHPTPPVPQENPRSTERDKEILIVGKMAKKSKLPVIVAGDLNDVAWSYTTKLFQDISGLLDPRRGRGFYNTFNARHFFFRYPLDHVFSSAEFHLLEIERLPDINSDHFPMWVKMVYIPNVTQDQEIPQADKEEKELAEKKINTPTD